MPHCHLGNTTPRHGKCTQQVQRCSGKFFLARVKFWSEHTRFVVENGKNILYCASRGKIMPCLGNVAQPVVDVYAVYIVIELELRCFVAILKLA